MAKLKIAAKPEGEEVTLAQAQAEEAAAEGQKVPRKPRGPSMRWTAEMDETLVGLIAEDPKVTIAALTNGLVEALGVALQVQQVRARIVYLKGEGVPIGRLGRETVKPDVSKLAGLLGKDPNPKKAAKATKAAA